MGVLEGKKEMVKKQLPKKTTTFKEATEIYMSSRAFADLKGSTQIDYERHLKHACMTKVEGRSLGSYQLRAIKVRHMVEAYEQWYAISPRTSQYRKAVVSVCWRHMMRLDAVQHDPVSLVRTKSAQPRRTVWSRAQVMQFLDTAYSDFKWRSIGLIFHMAYEWGQRVGDMRLLKWDNINLQDKRVDFQQSKRLAEVHLPISNPLAAMLERQQQDFGFQEYVAPRVTPRNGKYSPYNRNEVPILVKQVREAAGLPDNLYASDLRRTVVTELMEAGVDDGNIMQVTGHKSYASMLPYRVNTLRGATKALQSRGNYGDVYDED